MGRTTTIAPHPDVLPTLPKATAPFTWAVAKVHRAATVSTMPKWMRRMAGIHQPTIVDALVRPPMRAAFWVAARSPKTQLRTLAILSPSTIPVAGPVLLGIPAISPLTLTPAEARARYGFDRPADAHHDWRAKQRSRVFDEGQPPEESGMVESQAILGRM